MLLPRSHTWTPIQRLLIVTGVALVLVTLGMLIYTYERYYRGPGESAFYGTWLDPMFDFGDTQYWEFHADQTFAMVMVINGTKTLIFKGRWYAGGPNLYLRFPADWDVRRPVVMRIVDVSADQFAVRLWRESDARVYRFRRTTVESARPI